MRNPSNFDLNQSNSSIEKKRNITSSSLLSVRPSPQQMLIRSQSESKKKRSSTNKHKRSKSKAKSINSYPRLKIYFDGTNCDYDDNNSDTTMTSTSSTTSTDQSSTSSSSHRSSPSSSSSSSSSYLYTSVSSPIIKKDESNNGDNSILKKKHILLNTSHAPTLSSNSDYTLNQKQYTSEKKLANTLSFIHLDDNKSNGVIDSIETNSINTNNNSLINKVKY